MTVDFYAAATALRDEMVTMRRDLHRHPEMGFEEFRTAGIVAEQLTELGLEVQTGVGKTGVIGLMGGERPGPTVLLRFDMDALPIHEANTVEYASTNPGVMHACGHDGHVTIGLAVAKLMHQQRNQLNGTLKFVFQPAEEGLGGAAAMVKDGALTNPKPDIALGLHLWNDQPVGWVAASPGAVMSAADVLEIVIDGSGGHGAAPHLAHDPIVAGAQIVSALQSVVARNVDARETAVISITQFHAGDAFNVIPGTAKLGGTVRTYNPKIRDIVLQRIHAIVEGTATAMGCSATVKITPATRAVVNDEAIAQRVREKANQAPNVFSHVADNERTMGSEDYGDLAAEAPSCYFFVGSANAERDLHYPHHHPRFDFDEQALVNGAALMAAAVASYVLPEGR